MTIEQLELEPAQTAEETPAPEEQQAPAEPPFSPTLVMVAAFLAAAAAAWTVGGLFGGVLPRLVAIVAAALGAGITGGVARAKRAASWQALALPAIVLAALAAGLAGGDARGGLVGALRDALHGGGPSGQPMAFGAGWRMLVVLLIGTVAAGACSLALSTRRARLAVIVPVPPMIAAALVQPKGSTLSSGIPAMVLVLGALVAAYGVELAAEGASTGRFEMRRIARGVVAIAGIAALLAGVSRAGFLFPVPDQERVIPPQLPPVVPPPPDHQLFTVRSSSTGPWRLGVLDVYDGSAWRLPPYDPARFVPVGADGTVQHTSPRAPTVTATFTITDLAGPVLPALADPARVTGTQVTYDPRTQVVRSDARAIEPGATYTVASAPAPSGKELAGAPGAPADIARDFLSVPPPPPAVTTLLANAPRAPLWDRLQYVRTAFYRKVVASGAGRPAAVPPARVAQILQGSPASPYEISAAEALLARWAGVPSRIGYGFYQGQRLKSGALSVHPDNAATWLEVYFRGYGWVPVVGVPPRAKSSLDQRKETNPLIRPTDQLALVLYVPVRQPTIRLLYVVARYWLFVSLPFIALALLLLAFYPWALKLARRARRRRWAQRRGPRARIAVAYAELRDSATDLNAGDPMLTPFDFLKAVAHDEELEELSWLVSRALWGDLQRDLRDEDADAAGSMARSVGRRLHRAQPAPTRLLALSSRASLREPYLREVPNMWRPRPGRRRALVAVTASVLALALAGSCASGGVTRASARGPSFPSRVVPDVLADVAFRHEPAVESRIRDAGADSLLNGARVYTFLSGGTVQGYIEVGSFAPGIDASRREVRRGILQSLGETPFQLTRAGLLRVYTASDQQRGMVLWFAPDGSYFELIVARRAFGDPLPLFADVLGYQGNKVGTNTPSAQTLTPVDPRRGEPA